MSVRVAGRTQTATGESARVTLGETYEFVVESDRGGDLVLLDINAAGELTQIFPNDRSIAGGVSNRIPAGGAITLPGEDAGFRFRAAPPRGPGLVIAVVSDGSAQLETLVSRYKDLSVVARPEAYLVEIGEALRRPAAEGRGAGWRVGTLAYEIVDSGGSDSP